MRILEPVLVLCHQASSKTWGVVPGSTVYVAGAGPVGLACVASCQLLGASIVIVGEAKPEPPSAPEQLHSDEVGPGWYNIIRETRVNVAIGFDSTKVTSLEQGSRVRVLQVVPQQLQVVPHDRRKENREVWGLRQGLAWHL
jgi:2-polyprenyl-6-methoxyphenol hydroxylase-like FAD-dependent oxidoreductase